MDDVKRWLGAEVLYGKPGMLNLVDNYLVAAMQISNFLEYIREGSLIITPGDRSDIVISSLASRISSAYPNISGVLITGGIELSPSVQRLIQGWSGIPVPVLFVESHTFDTVQSVNELYGRIEPTDSKRIATALGWFGKYVNVSELTRRVVSQRSIKVTPRMFEYSLLETAWPTSSCSAGRRKFAPRPRSWASTSTAPPSSTRPSRSSTTISCRPTLTCASTRTSSWTWPATACPTRPTSAP
jgi:phosphate acetyltransferase